MADYGIFGKGSSGNSWFANRLNDFHDSTKKYDPISHYAVEWPMKAAHGLVEKTSGGLARAGIAPGFNSRLNQEAGENKGNFGLGSQRMGVGILGTLGAMYGYGAATGGSAGSTGIGATEGAPSALGYGTEGASGYTMPGTGSELNGAGLDAYGFNPNADLGVVNGDFAGTQGGGGWMDKMSGMMGQGGGQQGGSQRTGRQNLPFMENEKTDQQKLAELLQALQTQQEGY